MPETIQQSLSRIASQQPQAVAIATLEQQWTYAELDAFVRGVENSIFSTGIDRQSIVAVAAPRGPLGALFAIASAGNYTALPIPAGTSPDVITALLRDLQASCLVAEIDRKSVV